MNSLLQNFNWTLDFQNNFNSFVVTMGLHNMDVEVTTCTDTGCTSATITSNVCPYTFSNTYQDGVAAVTSVEFGFKCKVLNQCQAGIVSLTAQTQNVYFDLAGLLSWTIPVVIIIAFVICLVAVIIAVIVISCVAKKE